jgi:hypothetical protein
LMFDSRRTEKSDYRRTDRSFTLGGLFHWLSTNNQLSLLFVVNQRIFVRLQVAGLVAGSSRRDEVLLGIDF